jgi:hypothetical protein
MGTHNPYIEEEQTTQWPKENVQKDKQRSAEHQRYTCTQIKIKEPRLYCCSTFHSHDRFSAMNIIHTIK